MDVGVRKLLITKNRCNGRWNVSCTCCDKDLSNPTFKMAVWYAAHHLNSRHHRYVMRVSPVKLTNFHPIEQSFTISLGLADYEDVQAFRANFANIPSGNGKATVKQLLDLILDGNPNVPPTVQGVIR